MTSSPASTTFSQGNRTCRIPARTVLLSRKPTVPTTRNLPRARRANWGIPNPNTALPPLRKPQNRRIYARMWMTGGSSNLKTKEQRELW
eukprot:16254985-Heterocapsa_arctica.AAC.1